MNDLIEAKKEIDIVSVVEQAGIDLRKSGKKFVGLCPFHEEKTPSFFVYPESGRFRCFGCGASGDVIDFVQHSYNLSFQGALKFLGLWEEDNLSEEEREVVERRKHRRDLIKEFRQWERDTKIRLDTMIKEASRLLKSIKTPEDLETYGSLFHYRELWDYWLTWILIGTDDEVKFKLFKWDRDAGI